MRFVTNSPSGHKLHVIVGESVDVDVGSFHRKFYPNRIFVSISAAEFALTIIYCYIQRFSIATITNEATMTVSCPWRKSPR
mgnify:CR=1 FL=1